MSRSDAVRAGLRQVMGTVTQLGTPRFAVGVCDWWLARMLVHQAQDLGLRVHPGDIGPDRADAELLRRGACDMPPSVDVVVIGRGDGAFTDLARAQRDAGRRVVVVANPGRISRSLAEAADEALLIDLDGPIPTAA